MNLRSLCRVFAPFILSSVLLSSAAMAQGQTRAVGESIEPRSFLVSPEDETVARAYIQKFPRIAIGFTMAPGNGHQATAVLVMKRLRSLGFNGEFDLYIEPGIRKKLEYLLPGYDPEGPAEQVLPALRARTRELSGGSNWMANEVARPKTRSIRTLGFLGGDDSFRSPHSMNVEMLVRINPPGSKFPPELLYQDRRLIGGAKRLSLTFAQSFPIRMEAPNPADLAEFLAKEMGRSQDLARKIPGLKAVLIEAMRREVLTAYGLGFQDGPRKLAGLLNAARTLRVESPELLRPGLIVPLLSQFDEGEWADFAKRIEGVRVIDITAPDVSARLAALGPDEIAIVKIGAVSQEVWNHLMDVSTLPPTAAGTMGTAYLAARGRPFINTVWYPELPALASQFAGFESDAELITRAYARALSQNAGDAVRFFREARDPASRLSREYAEMGERHRAAPDRVTTALKALSLMDCASLLAPEN